MKKIPFEPKTIPIKSIDVIRHRDRDKDEFEGLVKSIGGGQIKSVFVKEGDEGRYKLFSGEGRIEALKALGKTEVRALVFLKGSIDDKEVMLEWLSANARRDNPPLQEAIFMAYDLEKGLSLEQIAERYGKKEGTVRSMIRTLKTADEQLIKDVDEGTIKFHQAQDITGHFPDKHDQKEILSYLKDEKLPASATRAVINTFRKAKKSLGKAPNRSQMQQGISGLERDKAKTNRQIQFYREKLAILANITQISLNDAKLLRLLTLHKIRFSDLLNLEQL